MPSTKISPFTISFKNSEEFHVLKNEVFTQNAYYFETNNPTPLIIDAGAHIGLTTLYFKKIFPESHIIAIEPNPHILPLLKENIAQNGLTEVEVIPFALSEETGTKNLFIDETKDQWWSTASFHDGAWNQQQTSKPIEVETAPLSDYLTEPVDFLKMDIEGAETAVLAAAGHKLYLVKHMMIEFHPTASQQLQKLIDFLQEKGFATHIWKDGNEITEAKRAKGLVYIEAINRKNKPD